MILPPACSSYRWEFPFYIPCPKIYCKISEKTKPRHASCRKDGKRKDSIPSRPIQSNFLDALRFPIHSWKILFSFTHPHLRCISWSSQPGCHSPTPSNHRVFFRFYPYHSATSSLWRVQKTSHLITVTKVPSFTSSRELLPDPMPERKLNLEFRLSSLAASKKLHRLPPESSLSYNPLHQTLALSELQMWFVLPS